MVELERRFCSLLLLDRLLNLTFMTSVLGGSTCLWLNSSQALLELSESDDRPSMSLQVVFFYSEREKYTIKQ